MARGPKAFSANWVGVNPGLASVTVESSWENLALNGVGGEDPRKDHLLPMVGTARHLLFRAGGLVDAPIVGTDKH